MKKIILTALLIGFICFSNVFSEKTFIESEILLKYNYLAGNKYKYKKSVTNENEQYISYIQIQTLDSTQKGDINLKYSIDSCSYTLVTSSKKSTMKKDMEKAQMQVQFKKTGKLLNIQLLDKNNNEYLESTGNFNNDERLFELPKKKIKIGYSWAAIRDYDYKFQSIEFSQTSTIHNTFIGLEQKNNRDCYRIDIKGKFTNILGQGHFSTTESGLITGSYWIEKSTNIIIGVETTYTYKSNIANHGIESMPFKTTPETKTTIELID